VGSHLPENKIEFIVVFFGLQSSASPFHLYLTFSSSIDVRLAIQKVCEFSGKIPEVVESYNF